MQVVSCERIHAHVAGATQIRCDLPDRVVRDYPVSVCFFYDRWLDPNSIAHGLGAVLGPYVVFDARVMQSASALFLQCGRTGVSFSVVKSPQTIQEAMASLHAPQGGRLCDIIQPRRALARGEPVLTARLTHFADGTSSLGMCWHHSVGDMHSFMQLMRAWSKAVTGAKFDTPLIVEDRAAYLDRVLSDASRAAPGMRRLGARELATLGVYMLTRARDQAFVLFYFSQRELDALREAVGEAAGMRLSVNDALCAHLFTLVADRDPIQRARNLSIAVNFRKRANLPEGLLGNMVTVLHRRSEPGASAASVARALRSGIDAFNDEHMDYRANVRFVKQRGGERQLWRFVGNGLDPVRGTLLVTNWSRVGVYDVDFGGAAPLYFQVLGKAPFPWISSIYEGFTNRGLVFSLLLPRAIATRLTCPSGVRAVHQHRRPDDDIPALARSLSWVQ